MNKQFYRLKDCEQKKYFTTESGLEPIFSIFQTSVYVEKESICYQENSWYGVGACIYYRAPEWFQNNLEEINYIKIRPKSRLSFI